MKSTEDKKILVAFFSATGTTRQTASQLAEIMEADLYEIKPERPYTREDLDWHNKRSRSSLEMENLSSRPAISGKLDNMTDYDVVFIGFPIWWYTAPTIVDTFIESYDLSGKTLIPFATSGGSTIRKSAEDLKKTYPTLTWEEGKLLNLPSRNQLEAWKRELGY